MMIIIICAVIAIILFLMNKFFLKYGSRVGSGMAKKRMDDLGMNYSDKEEKNDNQ